MARRELEVAAEAIAGKGIAQALRVDASRAARPRSTRSPD
jgi:hypothetical protein